MTDGSPPPPPDRNARYLQIELLRLRLLLRRRLLWIRARESANQGLLSPHVAPSAAASPASPRPAGPAPAEDPAAEGARRDPVDPEAVAIHEALSEVHARLLAELHAMEAEGRQPALATMVQLFSLTPFACDVLLLCLAPELDPEISRLYAEVQGDPARAYPTLHLATALFGGPPDLALARREDLMPHAPLRRYRLVTVEIDRAGTGPLASAPLRIEERAADYLFGVNRPDERLEAFLHPVSPEPISPEERERVARLRELLLAGAGPREWPVVNVVGATASGRRALAEAACSALPIRLHELDPAFFADRSEGREDLLRRLERESLFLQCALFVDRAATEGDEAARKGVDALAERLDSIVLVGSREQTTFARRTIPLFASAYDAGARLRAWQSALAGVEHAAGDGLDALVQQFDFDPQAIARAARAAQARARMRPEGGTTVTFDDLWSACRDGERASLDDLARRVVPAHTWSDIVLPDDVASQLHDIAAQIEDRPQVYERWGFGQKLGRGRGISVLFAGASGTGKTMAAEILAGHLRLHLYRIDLSGVVSKYIGETEKNLRRVFDAAEQSGAILFFDEADALFGKRSEVKDSHDRYANIEVNYLLQRMEDYRGLAILATNMKSALDEAFLRRLRFVVDFPVPSAADRARIWQRSFPEDALDGPLDLTALSRLEVPGGNIKNIALNAAFLAAKERSKIRTDHVFRAARREYQKLEKIIVEEEFAAPRAPRG